jgi:hypothetical protein
VVRSRLVAAALLVGFLATFAAPCLAAGPGEQAAMACCERMQHACGDSQIAQACCRAGDASQHDRDIQPTRAVVKLVIDAVLAAAPTPMTPVFADTRTSPLSPSLLTAALTPARHRPLLI